MPSAYAATRIQVLVALARRGIGGPFRAGYLQRRLAHDTGGEVTFEATWPGEGTEHDTAPRTMALSSMGAVTNTWCVTRGFAFERAPNAPCRRRERSGRRGPAQQRRSGKGRGALDRSGAGSFHLMGCSRCHPRRRPGNSILRGTDDIAAYPARGAISGTTLLASPMR